MDDRGAAVAQLDSFHAEQEQRDIENRETKLNMPLIWYSECDDEVPQTQDCQHDTAQKTPVGLSSMSNPPPCRQGKDALTQLLSSVRSDYSESSRLQQARRSSGVIRHKHENDFGIKEAPAEISGHGEQPQGFTHPVQENAYTDTPGQLQPHNLDSREVHLKSSDLSSPHKVYVMNSVASSVGSSQLRQSKLLPGKSSTRDIIDRRDNDKRRESHNAAANAAKHPSDGVFFAQYKGHPETLVVYRSPEERAANPERLNLDRRHLTVCPILKSEESVRLLNYQNNYIDQIRNLACLPNLIFLDLYNNCIESLSRDLECVPTLRVLMLGKNRIKVISHLEKLSKLDVLDLHSNAIAKVEQLGALSELRVLNLAGNRLAEIDQLGNLHSLTELNVRRNQIVKAESLQELQLLQRVFLSNNRIQSFEAVACLFSVRFLMELSMDGNPIALQDPPAYRHHAINRIRTLRHLDLKRVTDAERRAVALESQREDERRRTAEKHEMLELERQKLQAERHEAIRAAKRQWIDQTGRNARDLTVSSTSSGLAKHECALESSSNLTEFPREPAGCIFDRASGKRGKCCERLATQHEISYKTRHRDNIGKRLAETGVYSLCGDRPSSKRHPNHKMRLHGQHSSNNTFSMSLASSALSSDASRAQSGSDRAIFLNEPVNSTCGIAPAIGYYEVEIGGTYRDERILQLYGEAWECLESPKVIGSCTALVCRFVSVDRIVEKLRARARSFFKLQKITFGDNAIHTLRHIIQLASVFQAASNLVELTIESNPICSLSILRPLICAAFSNIKCFNGVVISEKDQSFHSARLAPICNCASNLDKEHKAFPAMNIHQKDGFEVTKRVVTTATTSALRSEEIRRALDKFWSLSINLLIEECIDENMLCDRFFERQQIWL